jgi:hypothetical protein
MHLKGTGEVGIGTTTPGDKVDLYCGAIADNVYSGIRISDGAWNANSHPSITFFNSNASGNFASGRISTEIGIAGQKSRLFFQVADASKAIQERMTINYDGNVGIGTSTPSSLLHLRTTGPAILTLEADTDDITETDNARIILKQDTGAVVGRIGYRSGANALEIINENADSLILGTSNADRITILPDGKVGIGTTSPSSLLDVNGNIETTTVNGFTIAHNTHASTTSDNYAFNQSLQTTNSPTFAGLSLNGDINFSAITQGTTTPVISNVIKWSGPSDFGSIYYETYDSTNGRLVIETADDGDGDCFVVRNNYYASGKLDVLTVNRTYIKSMASFYIGSTEVIDINAKIDWARLKNIPASSTSVAGIVQLIDSTASTSTTQAPTANALKVVRDVAYAALPASGGTMTGNLIMNNYSITNVDNIIIGDPGSNEGIWWAGGNIWKIYESPDDLSNAAGNLQFVQNTTRRMTVKTDGSVDVPGRVTTPEVGLGKFSIEYNSADDCLDFVYTP